MTDNNIAIETRKQLDRELNLGLGISKALGDLRFLAERVNGKDSSFGITEGMAVMDALHAVQQAQKAWQDIAHAKMVATSKTA